MYISYIIKTLVFMSHMIHKILTVDFLSLK